MHVEAMKWSGMGVREYAAALQLSPTFLRIWRDRLDQGEVAIDWRVPHLHRSARARRIAALGVEKHDPVKS
ncbi:hypothetical protein [Ancylobacter defluvii]|uniref:Transposase n=1 Tax=Ancylobacter defluvii TaxID=1282440 RepID=A0A9W6NAM9_9HYPH|nr:hypothetical protein [Ancylobacter defluvii]MBS7588508.1 hypothetical protein [Ancylobacter defluvii]GLK83788.1 hypothetical protein GCM10017653_18580 [Ancylobacter defluvii]